MGSGSRFRPSNAPWLFWNPFLSLRCDLSAAHYSTTTKYISVSVLSFLVTLRAPYSLYPSSQAAKIFPSVRRSPTRETGTWSNARSQNQRPPNVNCTTLALPHARAALRSRWDRERPASQPQPAPGHQPQGLCWNYSCSITPSSLANGCAESTKYDLKLPLKAFSSDRQSFAPPHPKSVRSPTSIRPSKTYIIVPSQPKALLALLADSVASPCPLQPSPLPWPLFYRGIPQIRSSSLAPPTRPRHPTHNLTLHLSAAVMASYQQYAQLGKEAAGGSAAKDNSSCKQPPYR